MLIKVRGQKLEVGRKNYRLKAFFFGLSFLFYGISSYAQCAMCRAALAGESNKVKAQAVNDGIVYLMVIPYILVALIGFAVYRIYSKKNSNS
jgi:hypothetical protein